MSPWLFIFLFLIVASGVLHLIVWHRFSYYLELSTYQKKIFFFIILVPYLSIPLMKFITYSYMSQATGFIMSLSMTWIGIMFFSASVAFIFDVIILIYLLLKKVGHNPAQKLSADRRLFLKNSLRFTSALGIGGTSAIGIKNALRPPQIKPITVFIDSLPTNFEGFQILQISDLHMGPTIQKNFVNEVVKAAQSTSPDIVAYTGDLVDGTIEELKDVALLLRNITSTYGSYFVTGNHEYYSGAQNWKVFFTKELNFKVLSNQYEPLYIKKDKINIAGVEDWGARRRSKSLGADHKKALSNIPQNETTILLSHQPKGFLTAEKYKVDLQLSGHTHGGQIWPFHWAVKLVQPYVKGLHQLNNSQIYVNTGTGFWGPTMRVGTESEITLITLKKSKKS